MHAAWRGSRTIASSSNSSPSTSQKGARAWLEHLPEGTIHDWVDLKKAFVGNFQGTYKRPESSWDLKRCIQKSGESLRDYIRRFSQKRNELPDATDADVVSAFTYGTTNEALVHELGRGQPRTTADLLDIATKFVDGENVVGAIFRKGKSPRDAGKPSCEKKERREHPDRRRRNHRPRRDEEVATADQPPRPPAKNGGDQFQKLMDSSCQNHGFPVRHKLRECELLKRFISKPPAKKAKPEEPAKPAEQEAPAKDFPETMGCLMIFGGVEVYGYRRHRKMAYREVHVAEPAVPRYLRWSEFPIVFDRRDHPDRIPHPGPTPSSLSQTWARSVSIRYSWMEEATSILCILRPSTD